MELYNVMKLLRFTEITSHIGLQTHHNSSRGCTVLHSTGRSNSITSYLADWTSRQLTTYNLLYNGN